MAGKINLRSSDNVDFSMDVELAKISETIKTMLEDLGSDEASR